MIVPSYRDIFTERGAGAWFEANFGELGFDKILKEHSEEYLWRFRRIKRDMVKNSLARNMQGAGRPDYLALREGKWLRIEIEGQTRNFYHSPNQCDVIVCYVNDSPNQERFDHHEIIEISRLLEEKK